MKASSCYLLEDILAIPSDPSLPRQSRLFQLCPQEDYAHLCRLTLGIWEIPVIPSNLSCDLA